jgi:hypothetical protein
MAERFFSSAEIYTHRHGRSDYCDAAIHNEYDITLRLPMRKRPTIEALDAIECCRRRCNPPSTIRASRSRKLFPIMSDPCVEYVTARAGHTVVSPWFDAVHFGLE